MIPTLHTRYKSFFTQLIVVCMVLVASPLFVPSASAQSCPSDVDVPDDWNIFTSPDDYLAEGAPAVGSGNGKPNLYVIHEGGGNYWIYVDAREYFYWCGIGEFDSLEYTYSLVMGNGTLNGSGDAFGYEDVILDLYWTYPQPNRYTGGNWVFTFTPPEGYGGETFPDDIELRLNSVRLHPTHVGVSSLTGPSSVTTGDAAQYDAGLTVGAYTTPPGGDDEAGYSFFLQRNYQGIIQTTTFQLLPFTSPWTTVLNRSGTIDFSGVEPGDDYGVCVAPVVWSNWAPSGYLFPVSPNPLVEVSCIPVTVVPLSHNFTASTTGEGIGVITSAPGGISCGADCVGSFAEDSLVNLIATPTTGYFDSWSGACAGQGPSCWVTITGAMSATATFWDEGEEPTPPSPVDLSISSLPAGISVVPPGSGCTPPCSRTFNFSVLPNVPNGTYEVTITGQPLGKTLNFDLEVEGSSLSVTCVPSPSTADIGDTITWTATPSGGVPPYTYSWSGSGVPTPAPTSSVFSLSYSTVGQKFATAQVTDADSQVFSCPQGSSAFIDFEPTFEEI